MRLKSNPWVREALNLIGFIITICTCGYGLCALLAAIGGEACQSKVIVNVSTCPPQANPSASVAWSDHGRHSWAAGARDSAGMDVHSEPGTAQSIGAQEGSQPSE